MVKDEVTRSGEEEVSGGAVPPVAEVGFMGGAEEMRGFPPPRTEVGGVRTSEEGTGTGVPMVEEMIGWFLVDLGFSSLDAVVLVIIVPALTGLVVGPKTPAPSLTPITALVSPPGLAVTNALVRGARDSVTGTALVVIVTTSVTFLVGFSPLVGFVSGMSVTMVCLVVGSRVLFGSLVPWTVSVVAVGVVFFLVVFVTSSFTEVVFSATVNGQFETVVEPFSESLKEKQCLR